MRTFYGLVLLQLSISAAEVQGQASPVDRRPAPRAVWGAQPLPDKLALHARVAGRQLVADTTERRPFFLPRAGEHTAYWVGWGAGLVVSPLLWCEGSGCGTLEKAGTSALLGMAGALSGLLLSRTF